MPQYVALLRGINVGGKNIIKMAALKACFEEQGFADVVTYIQSGNVLFTAAGTSAKLTRSIEEVLAATFSYSASLVLRSKKQLADIIQGAPRGFGTQPDKYRYDVIFLKEPLKAPAAMKSLTTKPGVDEAHAGPGALYFSRLISKGTQSELTRLISQPVYKSMTIRNWNTSTTLLRMMDGAT